MSIVTVGDVPEVTSLNAVPIEPPLVAPILCKIGYEILSIANEPPELYRLNVVIVKTKH